MNDINQLSTLYSNAIARAEKAEEALRKSEWQPIETAPRDGTDILLGFANHDRPPVVAAWFGDDGWEKYDSCNIVKGKPSHWMPLPSPPPVRATTQAETAS